ncbi:MAG: hypothetical protein PHF86_09730 [Candidatus Nanoarchaeia archaeon]|nr:hypothetical protein [Candidatus Nanoarchaeia archaeon]
MKDYQLIIKIPFEAIDDLDARNKAKLKIKNLSLDDAELKVQEVFKDQPPRKVPL